MANNKILITNSERLGIRDLTTIQKADAFLRVLNSKPSATTISDVAKIVLCLDLASTAVGTPFDKETALKLTGLRKNLYQNNLNNLQKILNLDKPISISELCVQFSCTEAKNLATTILKSYAERDTKIKDIEHPQYTAAAVYTSCKLHGIKVDKSQFKLISRLKATQWNELVEEFNKYATSLGLSVAQKRASKKDTIEEDYDPVEGELQVQNKMKQNEVVVEEYEIWRERILREASAEILKRDVD